MKVKLPLHTLSQLFDTRVSIQRIYPQVSAIGKEAGIYFSDLTVGNGYLQWDIPGEGWEKFDTLSPDLKSNVAEIYEERKEAVLSKLKGSFLSNFIFAVPSPEFIYFKEDDGVAKIALAAWGYKYPDRAPSGELQSWIHKKDLEDVKIAFSWNEHILPAVPFSIQGLNRTTSHDGFFYFDRKLPVGTTYDIEGPDNKKFNLSVIKGQYEYIFDLTKYFRVEVNTLKDGEPLPGKEFKIEFNGEQFSGITEENGRSIKRIPLLCDPTGSVSEFQPECKVFCDDSEKEHTPHHPEQLLSYEFEFNSPVGPPVIPPPPEDPGEEEEDDPEEEIITEEPKKRRFPWWIFLCLLPLLFLIRCHKDVEVTVVEPESQIEIPGMEVSLDYTSHHIFNNGKFFPNDSISRTEVTDSTGKAVFKDLPCSVFSYVFYSFSKMKIGAKNECHQAHEDKYNFHYRKHIKVNTEPRREDLHVRLLDLETEDPLPDARLILKYRELDDEIIDTLKTNPDGVVTIPAMRYCGDSELLLAQSYGYADTSRVNIPNREILVADDSTAMRLRPIKEKFNFFVKNEDTKEPIPGAICEVYLTHPSGRTQGPNTVTTSTDGKGIAFYEDSFILSVININAHKEHFRDSVLTGGPFTVESFIQQDEDTRTIWLKPLPYVQEFINVDSISGKPIPGVTNIIKVIDVDGKETTFEEISNSNGVFPVEAKEDSRVEIISRKGPEYIDKISVFDKFKEADDKKIRMKPDLVTLTFRTVNAPKPNTLVPNCSLQVSGSISGSLPPSNSGNGEFQVSFRKVEYLSIKASRKNWVPTTDKVTNKNYEYLKVDQERRDIPLKQDLPPCSAGNLTEKVHNEVNHQRTYGMGIEEGNASIFVDFYGEPDHLQIIDGEGNVLVDKDVKNKNEGGVNPIPFHFRGGSVTVKITTSKSTSSWEYRLNCPK